MPHGIKGKWLLSNQFHLTNFVLILLLFLCLASFLFFPYLGKLKWWSTLKQKRMVKRNAHVAIVTTTTITAHKEKQANKQTMERMKKRKKQMENSCKYKTIRTIIVQAYCWQQHIYMCSSYMCAVRYVHFRMFSRVVWFMNNNLCIIVIPLCALSVHDTCVYEWVCERNLVLNHVCDYFFSALCCWLLLLLVVVVAIAIHLLCYILYVFSSSSSSGI